MKRFCHIFSCLMLLLSVIVTSCIRDDLSGCIYDQEVRVYYSYIPKVNSEKRGFDPKEVELITLFVFDEEQKFVKKLTDEAPEFGANYHHTVELEPGTYTFVSWANVKDCYSYSNENLIEGETSLKELLLLFNTGADNFVTTAPTPLFYGMNKFTVREGTGQTYVIPVVKNTYKINLKTEGLNRQSKDYTFSIGDKGNIYNFENTYASDEDVNYITACDVNSDLQPFGSLTVQRLLESRKYGIMKLTDKIENEEICDINLMEQLLLLRAAGADINLETTYEYDIELTFKNDTIFSIAINGWNFKGGEIDL